MRGLERRSEIRPQSSTALSPQLVDIITAFPSQNQRSLRREGVLTEFDEPGIDEEEQVMHDFVSFITFDLNWTFEQAAATFFGKQQNFANKDSGLAS